MRLHRRTFEGQPFMSLRDLDRALKVWERKDKRRTKPKAKRVKARQD